MDRLAGFLHKVAEQSLGTEDESNLLRNIGSIMGLNIATTNLPGALASASLQRRDNFSNPNLLKQVEEEAIKVLGSKRNIKTLPFGAPPTAMYVPPTNTAIEKKLQKFLQKFNPDIEPNHILISDSVKHNPYVLAHELGHAKNVKRNTLPSRLYSPSGMIGALSFFGGLGTASLVDDEYISPVLQGTSGVVAASKIPLLLEEASASIKAHKLLKKLDPSITKMKSLKSLGPAYMTYLLGSVGAAALPLLLDKLRVFHDE